MPEKGTDVDLLAARGSPRVALEDNLRLRPFCGSGLSSGMFLAFVFGAFGAIVAELLKRWQQWNDMPEKRFLALLKSIEFWANHSVSDPARRERWCL